MLDHRRISLKAMLSEWFFPSSLLCILAMELFFLVSPGHGIKVTSILLPLAASALMMYVWLKKGWRRMLETAFALTLVFWYPLTCVFNGDYYLTQSIGTVGPVCLACGVFYAVAFVLNSKQRVLFLRIFALLYAVVVSAIAWLGVYAAVSGRLITSPFTGAALGINWVYSTPSYRLNVFDMHPNFSACLFYTALALLVYLILGTRRKWLRGLFGFLCLGLYCAISLTVSNAAILVTSLMLGLITFAGITTGRKNSLKRYLAAALAALVVLGVVAVSFPLSLVGMNRLAQRIQGVQQETVAADQEDTVSSQADASDGVVFAQQRKDDTTFASRLEIYASVLPSIAKRPQTLLIGNLLKDAMEIPRKLLHYTELYHMHNGYLQALMVAGLPAFIASLGFTVLLVARMIRLYFCNQAPLMVKSLVLAPSALLCHGMLEAFLFIDTRQPNMIFFLLAGMLVTYSAQYSPWRKVDATLAESQPGSDSH